MMKLDPMDTLAEAVWRNGDPFSWSTEGLDDLCYFCARDRSSQILTEPTLAADQHQADCIWLWVCRSRSLNAGDFQLLAATIEGMAKEIALLNVDDDANWRDWVTVPAAATLVRKLRYPTDQPWRSEA